MKILAVDYGASRTGLAVCDPTEFLTTPITPQITLKARPKVAAEVCRIAQEQKAELIVVGLPLNMDGTEGERAEKSRKLGKTLQIWSGLPVRMWDERQTTCAAAVAKRLAGGKRSVLMAPMYRILDEIQRSFHDGGDPLKRYAEVRYLIVDDLGKRRPTGFVLDSLFSLIDQRYSAMLPTLVTTQYKPSDLVRRLAEQGDPDTAKAIVSRLRGGARVEHFDGPDGRLQ